VDLNGRVVLRARAEGQEQATELRLRHSTVIGPAMRFVSNRYHLARGLQLGFTTFQLTSLTVPVVCRDERRTYLWVPLSPDSALPPQPDVSPIMNGAALSAPASLLERRKLRMTKAQQNGHRDESPSIQLTGQATNAIRGDGGSNGIGIGALIAAAQALKEVLRDGYARASRLLAALKRHGKQSELLRSTLASLRQLQGLGG
jgi:hypothetical protein